MKRQRHSLFSLVIICMMILTLLPMNMVKAASTNFSFDHFSTDITSPTPVNTSLVNITGAFNGVSPDSLTFQVDQLQSSPTSSTGYVSVNTSKGVGIKPVVNGFNFAFNNVTLFQGLNQITVYGTNSNGNQVPGYAYVYYSNVPVISDIKLSDGRELNNGVPLIVQSTTPAATGNAVLMIQAPNADTVTVNGNPATYVGNFTFISPTVSLQSGINNVSILASNATMSYAQTRQLIYYPGNPTVYNTQIYNSSTGVTEKLDGNPTIGPTDSTGLEGTISGSIVFPLLSASPSPSGTGTITDSTGTVVATFTSISFTNGNKPDNNHQTYTFTLNPALSGASFQNQQNYTITMNVAYTTSNGTASSYPITIPFTYHTGMYMTGVNQLVNVQTSGSTVTADDASSFADGSMIFQLPIWLQTSLSASSIGTNNLTLTSSLPGFSATSYTTFDNNIAFKINSMQTGTQTLTFTLTDPANPSPALDTRSITVNFQPAPYIMMSNIYNNEIFNDTTNVFGQVTFKPVNFDPNPANADLSSFSITVNGKTVSFPVGTYDAATNKYKYNYDATTGTYESVYDPATGMFTFDTNTVPGMGLVSGSNKVTLSGVSYGTPVTTTLTVFNFSSSQPAVSGVAPVPYQTPPAVSDPNQDFVNTGTGNQNMFSTKDNAMDLLFTVTGVKIGSDNLVVTFDGNNVGTLTLGSGTLSGALSCSQSGTQFNCRVTDEQLTVGEHTMSIQVISSGGTVSVTSTLTVTREVVPYSVLSPKLPNEAVLNQNFVPVVIEADGADQVLIGKVAAAKDTSGNIFRYELDNLKAGLNPIKFTVIRGTQKLQGEVDVTYAATPTTGAQYKTTIPSSGTIKVFNSALTINLPKGTLLKKANITPGQDSPSIDLFNNQPLFFGIANQKDGRTVQKYNNDGVLTDISPASLAMNELLTPPHFTYSSPLYWVDAGYFDNSNLSQYNVVPGMQPYQPDNNYQNAFFNRTDKSFWMEPSQRGTITIQYDPYLRDTAAKDLSIWKFNPAENNIQWQNIGGKVDTGKHTVTAPFDGFGYYVIFSERNSYDDIMNHPYARDYLDLMYSRNIMLPKDNSVFGANDQITRGEFAEVLVKALNIPLTYDDNNLSFDDVPAVMVQGSLWDYRYVETASEHGVIRGISPRMFAPNAYISREDAAVMIARAMNLKLGNPDKDLTSLQKLFTDANTLRYYSISPVLAVTKAGVISGEPNTGTGTTGKPTYRFDPESNLTRAQAAVIATRIMTIMKAL